MSTDANGGRRPTVGGSELAAGLDVEIVGGLAAPVSDVIARWG
ncbi:hypothetical protein QGN32_21930 [Mycolicibacterium sp. ND9-15]|nr:hypothetical protein [Mycolicibacterium sp. ND9-15]WSE55983.1 hypothetical protein QGN32_21930 [Mycolicibacterium sp. ND9-15]